LSGDGAGTVCAVAGFGRMDEHGRRAAAGQGGRYFSPDETGFSDAGDDNAGLRSIDEIDGFGEILIQPRAQSLDRLRFNLEDFLPYLNDVFFCHPLPFKRRFSS
jgi:hypothetical protein